MNCFYCTVNAIFTLSSRNLRKGQAVLGLVLLMARLFTGTAVCYRTRSRCRHHPHTIACLPVCAAHCLHSHSLILIYVFQGNVRRYWLKT